MKTATSFARAIIGLFALFAISATHAATIMAYTVNCSTAVHLADFSSCAQRSVPTRGSGVYVAFSPTKFTMVRITATLTNLKPPLVNFWATQTVTLQKSTGATALTDADLDDANGSLISTVGAANGSPTFKIDPNIESSYIGSEDALVDSRAVSNAIGNEGLNPAAMPVGTIVSVEWSDGTSAQFQKIGNSTMMWVIVPGSAKNKDNQKITNTGANLGDALNNLNLNNLLKTLPNFDGADMAPGDWSFWDALPTGTVTVGPVCDSLALGC
jgi:hypothetical protein